MKEKPVAENQRSGVKESCQIEAWIQYRASQPAFELAAIAAPFVAAGDTKEIAFDKASSLVRDAAIHLDSIWDKRQRTPPSVSVFDYQINRSSGIREEFVGLELAMRLSDYKTPKSFWENLGKALADDPMELERLTDPLVRKIALTGLPIFDTDVLGKMRFRKWGSHRMKSYAGGKATKKIWDDIKAEEIAKKEAEEKAAKKKKIPPLNRSNSEIRHPI